MVKKIIKGFLLSIFTTLAGMYIYLEYIMPDSFESSWKWMIVQHFESTIISLGAIPNLLLFFVFIKRREDYKARGVLLGVIITAFVVMGFKFF